MSSMTRQHFQLIADSVRRTYQVTSFTEKNAIKKQAKYDAIRLIANDLAGSLATTNPQFDQDRFLAACGIEQGYSCGLCGQVFENETQRTKHQLAKHQD